MEMKRQDPRVVDLNDETNMRAVMLTAPGTKFSIRFVVFICFEHTV